MLLPFQGEGSAYYNTQGDALVLEQYSPFRAHADIMGIAFGGMNKKQ